MFSVLLMTGIYFGLQRAELEPELDRALTDIRRFASHGQHELVLRTHFVAYAYLLPITLECDSKALDSAPKSNSDPLAMPLSPALGSPMCWFYRLCIETDGHVLCVQSPKDLRGFVAINGASEAQEYLRSFSNVYTIKIMSDYNYVEVLNRPANDERFAIGDYRVLNKITGLNVVPNVTLYKGTFILTRYLVEYRGLATPSALVASVERLTPTGHWEFICIGRFPISLVEDYLEMPRAILPK